MASVVKYGITATDEGFAKTMQAAARSVTELGKASDASGGKSKTLNGQLREARKAAMELTLQWRELDDSMRNSDFGQSLKAQLDSVLQRAGELQDIKSDVSSEIKNIASDTMMWDGAKEGIGILSSSIQGMASVVGLCGGNVEAFTKALNVMKGVEAVTNTVIGIGNALQKNSALMVALRAVKTKLLSAAEKEATVAIGAETTATELQTEAQLANNAAVLANPYVLAAAAIIGLTAAIVAWVSATDDATAATEGIHEAVEGSNEANKEGYKTYIKMQTELDMVKKKTDAFNGSMEEEQKLVKELNDKYGESLGYYKSLAEWKAALADVSYYYCKVLEKEAIVQALTNRMADAYADMMSGEGDFDKNKAKFEKYQSMIADAVDDLQAYQLMLKNMKSAYGALPTNPSKNTKTPKSTKSTHSNKKATKQTKEQQTALEKLNKELDKYNKLYSSVKDKEGNGLKKATEYQQKILELEKKKLDYLVKGTDDYDNQVKKIREYYDTASDEYKKYSKLLRDSEIEKLSDTLDGLDFDIASDRESALSTIREIISKLQEGTDEFDKWQAKFKDLFPVEYWEDKLKSLQDQLKLPGVDVNEINKQIDEAERQLHSVKVKIGIEEDFKNDYERYLDALRKYNRDTQIRNSNNSGDTTDLNERLSKANEYYDELVRKGKMTRDEANKAIDAIMADVQNNELSGAIVSAFKSVDFENIVHYWEDKLAEAEDKLQNDNLTIEARLDIIEDKKLIEDRIYQLTKGDPPVIKARVEPEIIQKGSSDWLHLNYNEADAEIGRIVDEYNKGIIKTSDEAIEQIQKVNEELVKLGMKPIIVDIKTEGEKAIEDAQNYIGDFNDVVVSTVDSFSSLAKSISEGASAWDIFKNAISTVGSVLSGIQTVMQLITTLSQSQTAATIENAVATETLEGAELAKLGTDSASLEPTMAKAAASKAAAAALEQEAAAAMFAAHAEIPFVGAAIGAAQVGIMEGVLTGLKATQFLANGGIVQGPTTVGDRIMVGLNAGEMVINQRQQRNLFDALNHGVNYDDGGAQISSVKVKGSDLILAIKNYQKIHGKQF